MTGHNCNCRGDDTDSSSEEEIDELDEEEETDGPKKWVELNPSYDKISYGKKIEEKGTKYGFFRYFLFIFHQLNLCNPGKKKNKNKKNKNSATT